MDERFVEYNISNIRECPKNKMYCNVIIGTTKFQVHIKEWATKVGFSQNIVYVCTRLFMKKVVLEW